MSDSTASSPHAHMAEAIGALWWIPLVRGLLLIVLGVYALFHPEMTVAVLTKVVAFFLIADGVLAVLAGVLGKVPSRIWTIVRGIIAILIGVFVFSYPMLVAGLTATVVLYIIAFGAIAIGVLEIVAAIQDRKQLEGEGWLILGGALAILFGVLLLVAPLSFGKVIIRVLGAYAIFNGISLVIYAFRLRNVGKILGKTPE